VHPDRGGSVVAGAGGFVAFLDAVGVVPGPLDRAGAGAFGPLGDEQLGEVGQVFGEFSGPVLRGECPPSRWRCGGPGAGPW
jgi:hypothetical protein